MHVFGIERVVDNLAFKILVIRFLSYHPSDITSGEFFNIKHMYNIQTTGAANKTWTIHWSTITDQQ
jgi:hypothetical protein